MNYNGKTLRHEFKYIIDRRTYQLIKGRLKGLISPDEHSINGGYHIRSLYFDDRYGSALDEKESGIMQRRKYRIRIYEKSDKLIKLERKEKFGDYISKPSATVTKDEFYSICNGECSFLLSKSKLEQDFFCEIRTKGLAPAVIVDYYREAFVCKEGNVRITFDSDLQAGMNTADIFSENIHLADCFEPGTLLLEVKYDDYIPKHISQALQAGSLTKTANSKYVLCRLKQFDIFPVAEHIPLKL